MYIGFIEGLPITLNPTGLRVNYWGASGGRGSASGSRGGFASASRQRAFHIGFYKEVFRVASGYKGVCRI